MSETTKMKPGRIEVLTIGIDCPECEVEYSHESDGAISGYFYLEDIAHMPSTLRCENPMCRAEFKKPSVKHIGWGGS